MTSPVPLLQTRYSLALAVRRYLAASQPGLIAALGSSGRPPSAWLFVDALSVQVEGSGSAACVLRGAGPWTRPNAHNTARFPRLMVEIYADWSRSGGRVVSPDAEMRAWRAFEELRPALDRKTGFAETWGAVEATPSAPADPGLRVIGTQLIAEPDVFTIPEFDGGRRLQAYFGLTLG